MSKLPIGLIIKDLMTEKKISVSNISEQLGVSRQAIYQTYTRRHMEKEELKKWCAVLNITESEVYSRIEGEETKPDYLIEVLQRIEESFKEELRNKEEQLKRKDEQISQLLATNNALVMASLGKDKPVLSEDRLAA